MGIVHVARQSFRAIGGIESVVYALATRQVAGSRTVRPVALDRLFNKVRGMSGLVGGSPLMRTITQRSGFVTSDSRLGALVRWAVTRRSLLKRATLLQAPSAVADVPRGQLAYLVNQYPKISHSFIRREIKALEERGWRIRRFAARGWRDRPVDAADLAEQGATNYILKQGVVALLWTALLVAVSRPVRFWRAFLLAARMMRHSDRPAVLHLVYLLEACWLSRQLLLAGIRHLHAHFGTNSAEIAMLSGELAGIPFSFTAHGPEEFDKARALHLAEKIERASFVVAVCSFGRSQLFRAVTGSYWSRVKVVHCGIDEAFKAVAPAVVPGCRRLVCVGRLCEQKGQVLLIAAVAALRKSGLDFELVLVGDGEQRDVLEALIRTHDLGGVVSITGWADTSRVRQEMISARALVLPSFAEGLPVVVMEALALGRPVISTYVAGIPELVIDGETGWLVPAGSEQALSDAIRDCLQSSDARIAEMGDKGRVRALGRHDANDEAEKLEKLFDGALQC